MLKKLRGHQIEALTIYSDKMGKYYNDREKLKTILLLILFISALIYGITRAYPLISGVKITITEPYDGQFVATTTFKIKGYVERSKEIKIQGRSVNIDREGNFEETLVSSMPYTLITVEATDKYNHKVVKTLRVIPK